MYRVVLAAAAISGASLAPIPQTPPAAPRPSFAGTWAPADPARSDQLFAVGLTPIPGRAQLIIEQRGTNRLTVTIKIPDEVLDQFNPKLFARVYTTIMYNLFEPEGRSGGAGAGGVPPPTLPTWMGDRLVIPDPRPSERRMTTTYSMDGDRLKLETHVEIARDRINTVTEWFKKDK
jgi:hypothetical protein